MLDNSKGCNLSVCGFDLKLYPDVILDGETDAL